LAADATAAAFIIVNGNNFHDGALLIKFYFFVRVDVFGIKDN